MRELLGRGRFTFGACRGKTQCMARPEPRDEVPLDPRHAEIERCGLFPSFGKDCPSQIWKHAPVAQCICKTGTVSLGLPLNISKGQERNTKGKWISESGAAIPNGMPKEPPFPSYNRKKSVWSLPFPLLLLSATNLHPPPPPPSHVKAVGALRYAETNKQSKYNMFARTTWGKSWFHWRRGTNL